MTLIATLRYRHVVWLIVSCRAEISRAQLSRQFQKSLRYLWAPTCFLVFEKDKDMTPFLFPYLLYTRL